jgi:hypothetical protein
MVISALEEGTGGGSIVIVTMPVSAPHASETITEYVVVAEGVATGFEIVGSLNPLEGAQVKIAPPFTVRLVDPPTQISVDAAVTEALAPLFTVRVTLAVSASQLVEAITV